MRIINPYDVVFTKGDDLGQYNIKKVQRELLLFINKEDLDAPGKLIHGQAIQINISTQTGVVDSEIFTLGVRTKNNATIKMNVYCYSVVFDPILGLKNIQGAEFLLNNAYSTEIVEDYDTKYTSRPYIGVYDRNFSKNEDLMSCANDIFHNTSSIPLPLYYTTEQQRVEENDNVSIVWLDFNLVYEGHKLIDRNTTITIHDVKYFDNILNMFLNDTGNFINTLDKKGDSICFIDDLFVQSTQPLLDGFVYIYDTQDGTKFWRTKNVNEHVPMHEFRQRGQVCEDLIATQDSVITRSKLIENEYGSICLYYTPLLLGDKLEIYFKDYAPNNQPGNYRNAKICKSETSRNHLSKNVSEHLNMMGFD